MLLQRSKSSPSSSTELPLYTKPISAPMEAWKGAANRLLHSKGYQRFYLIMGCLSLILLVMVTLINKVILFKMSSFWFLCFGMVNNYCNEYRARD